MPDIFTREKRSWVMSRIRSTNTKPERALRRALRAQGMVGYRVNDRRLPGRPDVVFGRARLAVFVDGAFWHGHPSYLRRDRSSAYWNEKIAANIARDLRVRRRIRRSGWSVMRLWDFDVMRDPDRAASRVVRRIERLRTEP